jgi:hypothetical protein
LTAQAPPVCDGGFGSGTFLAGSVWFHWLNRFAPTVARWLYLHNVHIG